MFVQTFKLLGQVGLEKSLTKISILITLEGEIEKGKKKAKINISSLVLFTVIPHLSCIQNLKTLVLIDAELI